MKNYYADNPEKVTGLAKSLFQSERETDRLDGWFFVKEIQMDCDERFKDLPSALKAAKTLLEIARKLPLSISEYAVFAGAQRDAFARSYALINPAFKVETFSGYCDPTAVFDDIEPCPEIPQSRIDAVREHNKNSDYVKALNKTYRKCGHLTDEVVFFIEQVTGHLIPDMRGILAHGVNAAIDTIDEKIKSETDATRKINLEAMKISLSAALVLARRYAEIAREKAETHKGWDSKRFSLMAETLRAVPAFGAKDLYGAIQSYMLLWMLMCLEQTPNPFAFSVGNADRIFEPYRDAQGLSREAAASLFKHFLVFFNVGDRSWAISQNIIAGGRDEHGGDLTNECTYALFDAYYDMNLPQPILSVKLHKNTPDALYREMGRFFFTPGCLTPSLFNDDSMFEVLSKSGVEKADLKDYSIAGCQEPLIMGKDNGNTTNSWLNLGKILELTINDGVSTISGKRIFPSDGIDSSLERLSRIRELFYKNAERYAREMAKSGNDASRAVSLLPVPFLSALMGGMESGYDLRDTTRQGTKYNGSGCLIHGLTVVSDSFVAIDCFLDKYPRQTDRLIDALASNFENDGGLKSFLEKCPKFGNFIKQADTEAAEVAGKIADIVKSQKNYLDNPFRVDYSTPSTHLLYGYLVGATPDGRAARDMLNYGVDPLYGDAHNGLGYRTLSTFALPFEKMNGGYASHFGIDPNYFKGKTMEEKGLEFKNRVIGPLFFNPQNTGVSPFYLYVNVTTAEMLRRVLADPKTYAPGGVYIMRIHGTFVNFLDLSPAIQNDIIARLDPESTFV